VERSETYQGDLPEFHALSLEGRRLDSRQGESPMETGEERAGVRVDGGVPLPLTFSRKGREDDFRTQLLCSLATAFMCGEQSLFSGFLVQDF